ncbi:MAG: 50S ribosomal protein L17 [Chloroflexota bacterium]|nr:50S ribosomal protein L17 [Chloroflexota bacterium]
MRHRVKKRRLGRDAAHRKALYRNLMTELLRHERITTTEAKAKAVRPRVERLITKAVRSLDADRAEQVAARREVLRDLTDKEVMFKLFDELAYDYVDRPGGYTRIVRLGPRRGDGAQMAILELVE